MFTKLQPFLLPPPSLLFSSPSLSSSAQLLEPFRISHDIQLMSSGSGIIVGQSGSGFGGAGLETAFGGGASLPHQGVTTATGHTSELEDPPGLYEKVRIHTVCTHVILHVYVCTCTCILCMYIHVHV